MNIPQPDLIICTPCGERRKKPATKRRHVVDPMTGQEFDLDTCDEHDKKLAAKYLGHALINGHRRFAKKPHELNGGGLGHRVAVATGIAVPTLGAKRGRPRSVGIRPMAPDDPRRKYATPEEAHEAKKQKDRDRYYATAAVNKKQHGTVRSESARKRDAIRKRGSYVPLPDNIHKLRDGSFVELSAPFVCGTCDDTFSLFRALARHCNTQKHKMPGKVIRDQAKAKELRALQRSGAPKK